MTTFSACEMAQMIRRREISSVELVEAHLSRIDELQPVLNAFTTVDHEGARAQARVAESAVMRGDDVRPLHGVPISIKSSISVAGLLCEAGSKLRKGAIAKKDATLVSRLRAAGAVILGTTNLPEMLMAYESDNQLYGRTNNPWDLERTPGGSSGGEAAAIASCCSAAGVGSDSGGSIRIPAHFSGICGLKGTPGRIPGTGHDPECLGPFSLLGVVGPMARTVGDLKLMLEVMAGPDDGDVVADPVPLQSISDDALRRVPIGYIEQDDKVPVTAETRAAVQAAVRALQEQGFRVVPHALSNLEEIRRIWGTFFVGGGSMLLGQMYAGQESLMSPILQEFMEGASEDGPLRGERLMMDWLRRDQLRTQMMKEMEDVQVLLTPVCSVPAFRHRERSWDVEGRRVNYLDAMSYTQWFNVLGNPCVVVPVGRSADGLPIGVQVVARPWQEHLALGVAERIEAAFGWKHPPLLTHDERARIRK